MCRFLGYLAHVHRGRVCGLVFKWLKTTNGKKMCPSVSITLSRFFAVLSCLASFLFINARRTCAARCCLSPAAAAGARARSVLSVSLFVLVGLDWRSAPSLVAFFARGAAFGLLACCRLLCRRLAAVAPIQKTVTVLPCLTHPSQIDLSSGALPSRIPLSIRQTHAPESSSSRSALSCRALL